MTEQRLGMCKGPAPEHSRLLRRNRAPVLVKSQCRGHIWGPLEVQSHTWASTKSSTSDPYVPCDAELCQRVGTAAPPQPHLDQVGAASPSPWCLKAWGPSTLLRRLCTTQRLVLAPSNGPELGLWPPPHCLLPPLPRPPPRASRGKHFHDPTLQRRKPRLRQTERLVQARERQSQECDGAGGLQPTPPPPHSPLEMPPSTARRPRTRTQAPSFPQLTPLRFLVGAWGGAEGQGWGLCCAPAGPSRGPAASGPRRCQFQETSLVLALRPELGAAPTSRMGVAAARNGRRHEGEGGRGIHASGALPSLTPPGPGCKGSPLCWPWGPPALPGSLKAAHSSAAALHRCPSATSCYLHPRAPLAAARDFPPHTETQGRTQEPRLCSREPGGGLRSPSAGLLFWKARQQVGARQGPEGWQEDSEGPAKAPAPAAGHPQPLHQAVFFWGRVTPQVTRCTRSWARTADPDAEQPTAREAPARLVPRPAPGPPGPTSLRP